MCGGLFGGGGHANSGVKYQRQQQQKRQQRVNQGLQQINSMFSQFTPDWYKKQGTAYENYANPQLDQQYQKAGNQLTYKLADQGQLNGSLAGNRRADLNQTYHQQQQNIANKAQGRVTKAKQAVSQDQGNLVNALEASGDPSSIPQTATNAVDALKSQPAYQPLGQVFQSATSGLGNVLKGEQYYNMKQGLGRSYSLSPRGSGRIK